MAFVHLHNHTEYSLLDGFTHVKDMVERAGELGMPAVAITDHGVMGGIPALAFACDAYKKETGKEVKPIFGCEVYFTDDETLAIDHKPRLYHMILLAKTNEGYHNLLKLVSESHVDNFYYKPRTTFSQLQKYGHGIIGTSACIAGMIPRCLYKDNDFDAAVDWAKRFASCFDEGDFYIELQNQGIVTDTGMTQDELNHKLAEVAKAAGLKTIATNDFHYLLREDARAQDIMLCVGTGSKFNDADRLRFDNDEFYMKTEEEMRAALGPDFQDACDNTVEVAAKVNVVLERDSILPKFPLPEGETEESYFRKICEKGLVWRYGSPVPQAARDRYEYEASVIIKQGFPAYFLIVQEYINWARENGILVGPGRGSAAGSIVAYIMGITALEPMSNGLLFERFLSVERVEMPDIDVDFEQGRREDVIQHIKDLYGEDHVSQVITYGTLKAKNAVRDAARVLDYPYAVGDRICKFIGNEINITIDEALKVNPDFQKAYNSEEDIKQVVDAARSIEGHIRNEGVHACATIICRDPMSDHVAMKRDVKGKAIITQYDGHVTPDLGLLKMDFLGLRNLDVIGNACRNVRMTQGVEISPEDIPLDDEEAFKLIASGNTAGVFQVESPLYTSLFSRIPPKRFSDIVVSIAINRPGPLQTGMVDEYVKVVSGKKPVTYYDERLKPILEETYGTMIYQEQLMQISMAMSGFSAGKADKLRKAMGKKKVEVMNSLKGDFMDGAVKNGYALETATKIWDDAVHFAEYAFNKSHSAAYSVVVMRTAYLKAHYPMEYMAAVLSSYIGKNDDLVKYVSAANRNGTPVLSPDINQSGVDFTPTKEGIRFGLAGVSNVGVGVVEAIVAEREANGPYTSLHDFVNRLDSKCYNRRVLESLVKSGAFDSTGYTRKQLMYFVDETTLLQDASKHQRDKDRGQLSMFDLFADENIGFENDVPAPDGVEWDHRTMLAFEKDILGLYVTDHPLRPYEGTIARMTKFNLGSLADRDTGIQMATFVGMISHVETKLTKKGKRMATFTLEDTTGSAECILFDYAKFEDKIYEDAVVRLRGQYEISDRGSQIIVKEVEVIELKESAATQSFIEVYLNAGDFDQSTSLKLNRLFKQFPGNNAVFLIITQSDGRKFKAELPVKVDANNVTLKSELIDQFGVGVVR